MKKNHRSGIGLTLCVMTTVCTVEAAEISFEDVSKQAGISMGGTTYGASWGDFNGDGWPDLWVGNHDQPPSLYLNRQDGTFAEIARQVWAESPRSDYHGAAWADFDRDGDQDLIVVADAQYQGNELVPGDGMDHLLINHDGGFREESGARGLRARRSSRSPLWLDLDDDGRLDLLIVARHSKTAAASSLYYQTAQGHFKPGTDMLKQGRTSRREKYAAFVENLLNLNFTFPTDSFTAAHQEFAQLTDLTGDKKLDLLFFVQPMRVYGIESGALEEITYSLSLPEIRDLADVVSGDFNGDGHNDLFIASARYRSSDLQRPAANTLHATLLGHSNLAPKSDAKGFDFATSGAVTFEIHPEWFAADKIAISSRSKLPAGKVYTLDPRQMSPISEAALEQGRLAIGFDQQSGHWQVRNSVVWEHVDIIVRAQQPVTEVNLHRFERFKPQGRLHLLLGGEDTFTAAPNNIANPSASSCFSVTAGDFDNDMDLDVYLVCTGPIGNTDNRLYENDGNGNLQLVTNAGGASGSDLGRGDVVATADFDRDGFLDLLVTNGADPSSPFVTEGPHQLFRNKGNANHWLAVDLVGSSSNAEGIGATVEVTVQGRRQFREQSGGMHRFTQNHQRLHFGLGPHSTLESVVIHWPSGQRQELTDVRADQILRVVEP